ncbi:MAG: hypothetical protein ACREP6_04665 [Candidatus Binataceae bacterium]
MRNFRYLLLIAVLAALWLLTLGGPRNSSKVYAQLGAPPPPLPAPPPPPAAGPAGVTAPTPAAPVLAPAPGASLTAPQATPTPSSRIFNCSCFGAGSRTRWMGTVQASGYFQARQSAVNSCIAYNVNRRPSSSYLPPHRFSFFPTPVPPVTNGQTEPGLPTAQSPGLSGFSFLTSPQSAIIGQCNQCACN